MKTKLPASKKPLFQLDVPSKQCKVNARQFLVGEEKILLMAQESGTEADMIMGLKQVINNCVLDEDFDVNDLATFDLEYMFLKLRARSVNNVVTVSYRDNEDDKVYTFNIDLNEVSMLKNENTSNIIQIDDQMGIKMKFPSASLLEQIPPDLSATELVWYLIIKCIDQVYDEDSVYDLSTYSEEEINEFIESLDLETFKKIRDFFDMLPKMYYKIEYKNSLDHDRVIELTTLSDFFTWG